MSIIHAFSFGNVLLHTTSIFNILELINNIYTTIMDIIFWDFLILYQIFDKWNESSLLVINIVYTSCLKSCATAQDLGS